MATSLEYPVLPRQSTLSHLPPEYPLDAQDQISELLSTSPSLSRLVVLDDDPTGTQTCHDITVLTVWDVPTLTEEFQQPSRGFFILTNSRAHPPLEAENLIRTICENVLEAAKLTGQTVDIVLRGDSTLRGHFPLEADVAQSVFGPAQATILAPFFFQGGRLTINDVHYVAEGDSLVPAGETQFAQDATFGFKSSNLRDYVREKAPGRFTADQIHSISIEDIRTGGPSVVCERLRRFPKGSVVIVNAAAESDMHVFVAGLLLGMSFPLLSHLPSDLPFTLTTPHHFNHHHHHHSKIPHLHPNTIHLPHRRSLRLHLARHPAPAPLPASHPSLSLPFPRQTGALIIAGSYVPKTTAQLKYLTDKCGPTGTNTLCIIELQVEDIIASAERVQETIGLVVRDVERELLDGRDVLVMTSRRLVRGEDELGSLRIGSRVAEALVGVVAGVQVRPRFVVAKGGITSSDAATKGLNIKRALVVGQAAPGVPLWRCDEATARHPGVPFVVFPGNIKTLDNN
ncbi:hypothetical protein BO70DRAFT_350048 [Aspergillus heteromorphus CBS 117.55]|uniref:Ketose-bisphosphate aldolase class-II family protein n=1 Tax=Aspergillus heteromorphus CBS 117.55 TaxID=1448321 RepID=A0A317WZD0_9EURO|nr:uncharacterized protein BO70DRAFT_350048 [Aspergillus heteromorphus CBS 117.55]PWY90088.1 hypothetical protein BO70DRAFT_350048 [Aspergillus heteromorphus CBS 117.55]